MGEMWKGKQGDVGQSVQSFINASWITFGKITYHRMSTLQYVLHMEFDLWVN
jgi:hypothetical protein